MISYIFLYFLLSIHPIYISVVEINSKENNLEIVFKIFRDDLEDGIKNNLGKNVSIDSQYKVDLNNKIIQEYLNAVTSIKVNNEKKELLFLNFILENERIKINTKINNNSIIDTIEIYNEILIDVFSNQKNIIFFNIYNQFNNDFLDKSKKKTVLFIKKVNKSISCN
tara:strand:- start:484 stop:984 length:501 start_codon:yes stop_codon:yes gene_type:complete